MGFDRIIVGVDGSDLGFEALQQALVLRAPNGTLSAVFVLEAHLAASTGVGASRVAVEMTHLAERTRARAKALLDGQPFCDTTIVGGFPAAVLKELCRRRSATLVAVGARGHSRVAALMLGGVSTTLLHDAPCSVLLARPRVGEVWSPQRILVGIDGSQESLAALNTAEELARRFDASLTVLAATGGKRIDPGQEWARQVDIWASGRPVAALIDPSIGADLVIVGSRGLHGLRSLGSVSERVAHEAQCSVLVVRPATYDDNSVDVAGAVS